MASSYGGRNRKCAACYASWLLQDQYHTVSDGAVKGLVGGGKDRALLPEIGIERGRGREQGQEMIVQTDDQLEDGIRATLESMKVHYSHPLSCPTPPHSTLHSTALPCYALR